MTFAELDHPGFVAAAVGGMAATFALSLLLDCNAGHPLADRALDGLSAAYANTGYLGIPLALSLFGPDILPALVISVMATAVALFGLAIVLIEIDIATQPGLGANAAKGRQRARAEPARRRAARGFRLGRDGLPLPNAADGVGLGARARIFALSARGDRCELMAFQLAPSGEAA